MARWPSRWSDHRPPRSCHRSASRRSLHATTKPELPHGGTWRCTMAWAASPDGREYVITLRAGETTPAPWVNVLANASFGTVVSGKRQFIHLDRELPRISPHPWTNDPVSDVAGEFFYIRDGETGRFMVTRTAAGREPARRMSSGMALATPSLSISKKVFSRTAADLCRSRCTRSNLRRSSYAIFPGTPRRLSVTGYWRMGA